MTLPPKCMVVTPSGDLAEVRFGVRGFFTMARPSAHLKPAEQAEAWNKEHSITPQVAAAMMTGAVGGWSLGTTDPAGYTEAQGRTVAYGGLPIVVEGRETDDGLRRRLFDVVRHCHWKRMGAQETVNAIMELITKQ